MAQEDPIKEAFQKIKHDIYSLYSEMSSLKRDMAAMNHEMAKISEILLKITEKLPQNQENYPKNPIPTHPTVRQIDPTFNLQNSPNPTHIPAHFYRVIDGSNGERQPFSTGNEGVPTDRQTDRQTDNTTPNHLKNTQNLYKIPPKNSIEDAVRMLDSLDSLKKEIRLKFKQLTDQEILIFSTLYQMEEEQGPADYKTLALKLNLTESSIRDYIGRLLQKGIPVEKHKINNKKILLSVSENLKKIASLQTILQLRDL